ncbi:ABC protein [Mycena leptocephala]|nr:ABC protein [Mycena leptocephala]
MTTTTTRESSSHSDDGTVEGDEKAKGNINGQTAEKEKARDNLQLDSGEEHVRFRQKWWHLWVPAHRPPPPPTSLDAAPISPYVTASLFSRLTYTWITPMMVLGYQRTLQAADLWRMGPEQEAGYLTDALEAAWARRVEKAGEVKWALRGKEKREELEREWREKDGRREASLAWALNDVLGHMFWKGGRPRHLSAHGPLLVKALINFAKARAAAKAAGVEPVNIGHGIGMAFGLLIVIVLASICQHQFFFRSMITGVLARTALTGALYRRAVHLTPAARLRLPNSAVLNHVSTDVSRVDACAQWFHAAWTAPIQTTVCLIILLVELGPSALAGFALFLLIIPLQERIMAQQFSLRKASMKWTDERAGRVLEVVASMRVVKYFCYEGSFLARLFRIRTQELRGIRKIQHSQSANIALAFSLPVLAATLAFVTYTETSKQFDVAVVFASFSLFQLLRQPMMFLPRALSATADARNALARLSLVFRAPLREGAPFVVDTEQEAAVWAKGAGWVWEAAQPPFALHDITLSIPRGTLAAIVGRVGSGKSSLLQGLIGEMRTTGGKWAFGGSVAYCPQSAWIQNATLRDNVLFGQPFEEERYWRVIEDSCLLPDLQLLADGDLTEKGINLSGGQKQRVNIARALYYGTDVVIFDDPLSAVDANVGKALFRSAIQGLVAQGKTVILVTHALHFLAQCDYIYTLDGGASRRRARTPSSSRAAASLPGSIASSGGQRRRMREGRRGENGDEDEAQVQVVSVEDARRGAGAQRGLRRQRGRGVERVWVLRQGGRRLATCRYRTLAVLMQGSQVANRMVVWWQGNTLITLLVYQILYALWGFPGHIHVPARPLHGLFRSPGLEEPAPPGDREIFHAPMSFFDTTPMGRIISIFGKDIDTIDNALPMSMRMFILVLAQVLSSVIVITVLEHYFIVAAVLIIFGFSYFLQFYRASALEMKRLDSMLRSILYAHLSESLTGLPTIRSYERALFLTVTNQRWLAVRLDALGSLLVFLVAIFAAVGLNGVNPAEIGLILTYTTTLTQMFAVSTRLSAEVENYMNSVERVVHYARGDVVPQEAAHESTPQNKPAADWPAHGAIEFKDVTMAYRPGLPNVLRGISLKIHAGEKIGVVGRTGAGKSSLTLCLLRIVEYLGEIIVDGVNIGEIGLTDLRSNIAIIPQEPILFSGTVRTALDPFSKYDDARLWDALRRSYLVETRPSTPTDDAEPSGENRHRLTLDSTIETDGQNLSVGERSLLSLARALVKDSRVVILDEATASVDLETDNKIQRTIQTQFKDRTLICIAHRLRTIISYDRILVLDAGKIAEFDTPLNLFNRNESLFRSLCDKSNITSGDIEKAYIR